MFIAVSVSIPAIFTVSNAMFFVRSSVVTLTLLVLSVSKKLANLKFFSSVLFSKFSSCKGVSNTSKVSKFVLLSKFKVFILVNPIESESKAVFCDISILVIFGPPKTSFSNKRLLVTFIVSKTELPVYNSFKFLKSSNPCKVTISYVLLSVVVFKISIFSILEVSILLSLSKSFAVILWSPSIKACIKYASVMVVYCTVVQVPVVLNWVWASNVQFTELGKLSLSVKLSSTVIHVRFGLFCVSKSRILLLFPFLIFKVLSKLFCIKNSSILIFLEISKTVSLLSPIFNLLSSAKPSTVKLSIWLSPNINSVIFILFSKLIDSNKLYWIDNIKSSLLLDKSIFFIEWPSINNWVRALKSSIPVKSEIFSDSGTSW